MDLLTVCSEDSPFVGEKWEQWRGKSGPRRHESSQTRLTDSGNLAAKLLPAPGLCGAAFYLSSRSPSYLGCASRGPTWRVTAFSTSSRTASDRNVTHFHYLVVAKALRLIRSVTKRGGGLDVFAIALASALSRASNLILSRFPATSCFRGCGPRSGLFTGQDKGSSCGNLWRETSSAVIADSYRIGFCMTTLRSMVLPKEQVSSALKIGFTFLWLLHFCKLHARARALYCEGGRPHAFPKVAAPYASGSDARRTQRTDHTDIMQKHRTV